MGIYGGGVLVPDTVSGKVGRMVFGVLNSKRNLPSMPLFMMTQQRWRWAVADGQECARLMAEKHGSNPEKWPSGRVAAAEYGYCKDEDIAGYRSFLRGYGRSYDF